MSIGRIRKIHTKHNTVVISLPPEIFGPLVGKFFTMTVTSLPNDGWNIKLEKLVDDLVK